MKTTGPVFIALSLAVGCSSAPPQVITGRISPDFPMTVTKVVVYRGNSAVASSPIGADDTFRLEVPAHGGLRLALVGEGHSGVVFPRQAGTLDTEFAIRGHGADFDLGMIRFVGAAPATPFVFKPGTTTGGAECEDGHDASGAVCVDDEDDDNNTCGQDDEQEGEHEDGDDNDGEHDDGETDDDDGEQVDDGPNVGDAVAEHNFPADGCSDDDDHEDGESDDD